MGSHVTAPALIAFDGANAVMRDGNVSAHFHTGGVAIAAVRGGSGWGLHWGLADGAPAEMCPRRPLPGRVHSFVGDPSRWATNQATYGAMEWRDVQPGVDLDVESRVHGLKYTLRGVIGDRVRLRYAGAQSLRVDDDASAISVVTGLGEVREDGLVVTQDGQPVSARYEVLGADEYAIVLGEHDATRPIEIDPTITWSSFLGGLVGQAEGRTDEGRAIAVDSAGNVYVAGTTAATDFPGAGGFDASYNGGGDAFITKVDASGASVAWSTYLGGSGSDVAYGLAVDAAGNVYVGGHTASPDFPVLAGYDMTWGGDSGFVAKIEASGSTLLWSTFHGGYLTVVRGLAVDASGCVYAAGHTSQFNFPTVNGFGPVYNGGTDGFVSKLEPSGAALVWSSYLGGTGEDRANGIAIDGSGNVVLAGETTSSDFPASGGAYGGLRDGFIMKVAASGTAMAWSYFVGGSGVDKAHAISANAAGDIAIAGETNSSNFYVTPGAFDTIKVNVEGFVRKYTSVGGTAWSSFLGGSSQDWAYGVAVDEAGAVYVTGDTNSSDFAAVGGFDSTLGLRDAFVTKVASAGDAIAWSSYLGGAAWDAGYAIAVDAGGNAYVTGMAESPDFPLVGAFDVTGDGDEAFVSKVDAAGAVMAWSSFLGGTAGEGYDYATAVATDAAGDVYVAGYTYAIDFPAAGGFDATSAGNYDAFVTKVSAATTSVAWSTYLGGAGDDRAYAIGVDSGGAVVVAGRTASADFPVLLAFDGSLGGASDGFVTRIASSGAAVEWSSYLGGSDADNVAGLAVGGGGDVVLTGQTFSGDFPVAGGWDSTLDGLTDTFVTKVSTSGSLLWSSYLGGSGGDVGRAVGIDTAGDAYVAGGTSSSDFPLVGAFDSTFSGTEVFVAKVAGSGAGLVWSSFLGGSSSEQAFALAIDAAGNVYVTGETSSSDFPTTGGFDTTYAGGGFPASDGFVTKVASGGTGLVWSSYLGASGRDRGQGMAVNAAGDVFVVGFTDSTNLNATGGFDASAGGGYDAFVTRVTPSGSSLAWQSYLGGVADDQAAAVAVDAAGFVYVVGYTASPDFPSAGGFDTALSGAPDAFLTRINPAAPGSPGSLQQLRFDGVTDIPVGGWIGETNAVLRGVLSDPDGLSVKLQVEVRAVGTPFSNSSTAESGLVTSGGTASAAVSGLLLGVPCHWQARTVNSMGAASPWVSFGGNPEAAMDFGVDSPPVAGSVNDGTGPDIDMQVSLTTISANWSGFADGESGIAGYEWAIGTTPGGTTVQGWSSIGLATSATNSSLTLVGGTTYVVSVRATNGTGLTVVATSDGVVVETSAPTAGTVNDGTAADIDWQSSKTIVNANWTGFTDPESGITGYEWAIGTTPGASNIRPFTGVGLSTSATATGLSLSTNTWYYVSVRATNGVAMTVTASSDGFRVDTSAPSAGTVRDGTGADIDTQTSTTTLSANWSGFSDSQSGIAGYEWAIGTTSGGTNVQAFTSVGLATSATNASLTLTPGQKYWVTVRATNGAGLTKTKTSDGVTVNP